MNNAHFKKQGNNYLDYGFDKKFASDPYAKKVEHEASLQSSNVGWTNDQLQHNH